jgi:predicted Rossmann-fold nucleotide-binding protein
LRGAFLHANTVDMGKTPDHACEATTLPNMKRILVFCGSSPGGRPEYVECATALGRLCASRGVEVVYGGAHVGLMGALADATLDAGG